MYFLLSDNSVSTSEPILSGRQKVPLLVDKKHDIDIIIPQQFGSIACCPNRLLRYSLLFYGFVPDTTHKLISILRWAQRLLILFSLSMGFYSLSVTINSNNRGSLYLTATLDLVYPFFYIAFLKYFIKSPHFWKLCSVQGFVMTHYGRNYITLFLSGGLITSVAVASWQKIVWGKEHKPQNTFQFTMFILFWITFIIRMYVLFVGAIIFWITARFHQRQIKIYLKNIRDGNLDKMSINIVQHEIEEEYEKFFNLLVSIKTDMNYTNEQVQVYLSVLLITVLISLIVLVSGMLLSFIQITIFINNSSDLFLMGIIAMYVLFYAAQTTQRFANINKELTKYYHQNIAFTNWNTQNIIMFLMYTSKERNGFSLFGVLLDYGTVMRFCIILASSFLSTFGKKFYGTS